MFDNLYRDRIMRRNKLGYSTVYETSTILWDTLQSQEAMEKSPKHEIKYHPSTTSIFVRLIIKANIYDPLQEISQMNR